MDHGEGYTWAETTGTTWTEHRIDFIAVPREWVPTVSHQAVLLDSDPIATKEDHYPVVLRCRARALPRKIIGPWRRCIIDRSKLKDPVAVADFAKDIELIPPTPWKMGVDEHLDTIMTQIKAAAVKHFP
eukprot:15701428-Heterocapsa_arctica.AAC.1